MRLKSLFALASLLAAVLGAGAPCAEPSPPQKIAVVASFSILADLVGQIGGDRVEVKSLVGPQGDVHVYQPSPADAQSLARAKLIVVNGFALEGWMERLIAASGAHAPVVVASQGVTPRAGDAESGEKGVDPHAWQSIANARIYVANILAGLVAADPADAAVFEARAAEFDAKLDATEAQVRAAIEAIPAQNRRIVTTHDAFGYFGQAYGLAFIAAQGLSTESEPSARDVANLIDQIRREKAPAVFLENISDPRLMQRIARESGAKIGGTLFSDQLSKPDGPAATYIAMMEHNISELKKALVPPTH